MGRVNQNKKYHKYVVRVAMHVITMSRVYKQTLTYIIT